MSAEEKKGNGETIKLGVFLGLICGISACVLAFTDSMTKPAIKAASIQKNSKAISTLIQGFDNNPSQDAVAISSQGHEIIFYPAKKEGSLLGFVAQSSSSKGFGGDVTVMLSMSPAGLIQNVIVVKHNETPGLGTVVTDRVLKKSIFDLFSGSKAKEGALPPNSVLDSFRDLSVDSAPWTVRKDGGKIESVTGATISSRAVTDAVNIIAEAFKSEKEKIIGSNKQ